MTNPYWIEDPELKKGEVDFLSSAEIQFWKDLIDKYLFPIDQDKAEQVSLEQNSGDQIPSNFILFTQARIAVDLKDLRNSSVFGFFMINALFVLIVFLLQLNKDNLHVKWPISARVNVTYDEVTQEVKLLGTSIICNQQTLTTFFVCTISNYSRKLCK